MTHSKNEIKLLRIENTLKHEKKFQFYHIALLCMELIFFSKTPKILLPNFKEI